MGVVLMKIRKAKKRIPYGIYCYGLDEHGKQFVCPHRTSSKICNYLKHKEYDEDMIEDKCKECDCRTVVPPRVIKKYVVNNNMSKDVYKIFRDQERR
jgi:hypothetical protein